MARPVPFSRLDFLSKDVSRRVKTDERTIAPLVDTPTRLFVPEFVSQKMEGRAPRSVDRAFFSFCFGSSFP